MSGARAIVDRLRSAAGAAGSALLDMVYPPRCAACGLGLEDGSEWPHLCGGCSLKIRWIGPKACLRCGLPLGPYSDDHDGRWCVSCRTVPLAFGRASAAAIYEDTVSALVRGFKYDRRMHIGATLSAMLNRRAADVLGDGGYDWVAAVPLHGKKRRERGFDQSEYLASRLASAMRVPLLAGGLRRVRETPAQAGLSRTARFSNLKGAFEVARPDDVKGKRVIIVDDVMTTGATCSSVARALRNAGATVVAAAVVARALRG